MHMTIKSYIFTASIVSTYFLVYKKNNKKY